MDTLTPEQRHFAMSRIKGKNTSLERNIRGTLHRFGFRFRKNDSRLPGKPDAVFPRYKAALFINGCFWHWHEACRHMRLPKTNTEFWREKLSRNRARDKKEIEALLEEGWRVGVVWECSITGKTRAVKILNVAEEIALWLEEGCAEPFREF